MKKKDITTEEVEATLDSFQDLTPIFANLADMNRQRILTELGRHDRLNVKELTALIPLSRPAISHHLKNLKQAGLINNEKKGTENYYYLTIKDTITKMRNLITQIENTCTIL